MTEPLPQRTRRPLGRIGAAVLVVAVLAVAGEAAFLIGRQVWADHHFQAAEEAARRRDFEAARAHLALCLEIRPDDAQTHFQAARVARRAGSYDEAVEHLKRAKELDWEKNALDAEWAMLKAQNGDLADVQPILVAWVEQEHPDSVLILEALTQGYLKVYNLPAALQCLRQWLKREPDAPQALFWRGEAWERLHKYEEALADFGRVVQVAPERDDARLRLAEGFIHAHRPAEAAPHFETLHERQPGNPQVLLGLARCRLEQGRVDESRQLLDDLLNAQPDNGLALGERGKLELAAGKPVEAEHWLRRAAAIVPYEREVVYSFVWALEQCQKEEEAASWVKRLHQIDADLERMNEVMRLINKSPTDPAPRHEAGAILLRNGQEQEGLRWLHNALLHDPNYRATHELLAEYFEKHGQLDKAASHRQYAQRP